MSNNSSRMLGAGAERNRPMGRGQGGNGDGGGGFRGGPALNRGGDNRRRDGRFRRGRGRSGSSRGRGRGRFFESRKVEDLPDSIEGWEQKIEKEGPDAFLDFTLSFEGSGIPVLAGMVADFFDPGLVAGQEARALALASINSMKLGRVVGLDGNIGTSIRTKLVEKEFTRVNSGG